MLRDGKFIKEPPPRIGASHVKYQKTTPTFDDVVLQSLLLRKDTENTLWTKLQKLLPLS